MPHHHADGARNLPLAPTNPSAKLWEMSRRFWFAAMLAILLVALVMSNLLPGDPLGRVPSMRARMLVALLALATPLYLRSARSFHVRTPHVTSSTDFDLRKVTGPILIHLLGAELRFPRLFLWRCLATLPRFKQRIDDRFPKDLVELAAMPLWVYVNLKNELGQARAFEIMRVAVLTGGIAKWNLQYETVRKPRTFATLCEQELIVNRTGFTRWNSLEVLERTDRRFEIKITRCLYHELTTSLGIPEVTPIVCQIDNAAFNSYLPDEVLFQRAGRGHRIADGANECRFIWETRE